MTDAGYIPESTTPAPGWVGGFATSKPEFAYPACDLSSLPMPDNMANIDKLERQLDVLWPEFSWQTVKGDDDTRCFSMFNPDISRIGYDDEGRIFAIMCPQQGFYSDLLGVLNVEVTVTGTRGWIDERAPEAFIAADMKVMPRIWISRSQEESWFDDGGAFYKLLEFAANHTQHKFPLSKEDALVLRTFRTGTDDPIFPVRAGRDPGIANYPSDVDHSSVAWNKAYLEVQIGAIEPTGDDVLDGFNQALLDFFNALSGNLLQKDNVLTWNVWLNAPTVVNQQEWTRHAIEWRDSIQKHRPSPDGPGRPAAYRDGRRLTFESVAYDAAKHAIEDWLRRFL